MIVTIDGPAAAGKSSVAMRLAERLGYRALNTGAMYRAVALAALREGIDPSDAVALAALARRLSIRFDGTDVILDGENVSEAVRRPEVGAMTNRVADVPAVRDHLVGCQRALAAEWGNLVTDGRDQGTVAFPDAECKVFLTASRPVRAQRRWRELQAKGHPMTLEEVVDELRIRDEHDLARPVGALREAHDAYRVETDGLNPEEVLEKLVSLVLGQSTGSRS